ncbi:MAG: DUF1016 N-terminal domain-containing protein [Candidatus Scalindua rubra]|nr:DUF1016 N-terminal domain-containing protein [Candidatus Scalindua rubra]
MNRRFLKAMFEQLKKLRLLSGQANMDFTAIPHWGDASVLENNWPGKYGKRLKSVLSVLCQDPDTSIFCYSNAEIRHRNEAECVLEFVDFWEDGKKRAGYGEQLLISLSADIAAFGKGFSVENLQRMRQFFLAYPIDPDLCDSVA